MKHIVMVVTFFILLTSMVVAGVSDNFYWYRASGDDRFSVVVSAFPVVQDRSDPENPFPEIGSNDPDFNGDWLMQMLITPVGLQAVFATSTISGKSGFIIQGNIEEVWVNFSEVPSPTNPLITNLKYTLEINGDLVLGEEGTWELLDSKTKPKEALAYLFEQPNNPNSLKAIYVDVCTSFSGQIVINKDSRPTYRPFSYRIVDGAYSCEGFVQNME